MDIAIHQCREGTPASFAGACIAEMKNKNNALVEGITFRICRYIEASLPLRVVKMAATARIA